ncbi:MAG TPA: hypothetical protein VF596_03485 [Pyrinomonadaceae bacterium]|jgi:hypothetical protein
MANLDQVISQIRFGIEQLSSKSAHHEFEHLCRHLTRVRICSNILPATGPVSAGGDQGRDFETFRTYLNSTPIAASTFIGLASSKPIAFSCTLEKKEKIKGKIESDVKTIMSSGSPIEAIHYFCGTDLEVAKRHKLQKWAQDEYKIELEIYDGQAISELLADREVFWIAEKYLSIPGEIFPRLSEKDGGIWYSTVFSNWKDKKPIGDNFAEFSEIKMAARHAFYTENLRQDLPFWVNLLKENFVDSQITELKRRAIYEVCVLSLRGFKNLDGYEEYLRWFFSQIPQLNAIGLQDAEVLLQYCAGAVARSILPMTFQEISEWQHQVIQQIDKKLEEDNPHNTQAILLNIKGWTCIMIDPLNLKLPDFEKAIEWWLKLTEVLVFAPMFPLKQLSNNLDDLLEFIIQVNGKDRIPETYFELTEKIDALLAKRLGGFTAAENSRKRAFRLAENNRLIDAIDLLHRSKLDWFASETLEQALSMMMFLSRAYMELGLFFAGKYYALAVSFIAENNSQTEVKHFASLGLMRAATWDYMLGAFCSFLNLTEIEIKFHQIHARNAGDLDNSEELQSIVFHLLALKAITERIHPDLDKFVDKKVNQWLPNEWVEEILPHSRENLQQISDEELKQHLCNELFGTPFSDFGPVREVAWSALGIKWHITWKNDYETTKQAEQFLAILQIYLVEVAHFDLCLLKTNIDISIELSDLHEIKFESIPSNNKSIWKISVPKSNNLSAKDLQEKHTEVFSVVSHILLEASLLPTDNYFEIMENLFKKGLSNRIFVAQPYEILYGEFIQAKDFNQFDRTVEQESFLDIKGPLIEHEELSWNTQLGPTYNWEKAQQFLKNRYSRGLPQFQLTVELLRKFINFKEIIKDLREEGWLDWQIMSAITQAAMNYQFNLKGRHAISRKESDEIWQDIFSGKVEWNSVPREEFSKEKLLFYLRFSMIHTISLLDLESHQATPDLEAIDNFLRYKYNYWTNDVPHEDPFRDIK